jgi:predicted cupin superfamily sugar epimerase
MIGFGDDPMHVPLPSGARAREIVERLGLTPHPERGWFVETYRASLVRDGRNASTAIYFLVERDRPSSTLHRLKSDELFHLYEGGPLDVLLLGPGPGSRVVKLGLDLTAGERPQLVIPHGTWFGTELPPGPTHALFGCTVAPGFDFADFELAQGPELAARWPEHAERIARMTR